MLLRPGNAGSNTFADHPAARPGDPPHPRPHGSRLLSAWTGPAPATK